MKRPVACLFFLFFIALSGKAQTDFGTWNSVNAEYKASKEFLLFFSQEVRLNDNFCRFNQTFSEIGAEYKIFGNLRAALVFRNTFTTAQDNYLVRTDRLMLDISYRKKFDAWSVSYRQRLQFKNDGDFTAIDDGAKYYSRNKFGIKFNTQKRTCFFASAEFFVCLNQNSQKHNAVTWDCSRYSVGINYKLNKHFDADFFYLLNQEIHIIQPVISHIVGINLNYSL